MTMRVLGQHQHGSYEDFKKRVRERFDQEDDINVYLDELMAEAKACIILGSMVRSQHITFVAPIPKEAAEHAHDRLTDALVELSEFNHGAQIEVSCQPDGDDWVALTAVIDLRGVTR